MSTVRGCHRPALRGKHPSRPAAGVGENPQERPSAVDVERAARLYRGGASARGIGRLLGTSRTAVYNALRASGVAMRPRGTRNAERALDHVDRDATTRTHQS